MHPLQASVIISTYNQPEWLAKCLTGYKYQSVSDFEIIIADDGSDQTTAGLIENFRLQLECPLKHIWHPDQGFRKNVILNKAILECQSDYLIFTDGDCIPRSDFIQTHLELRSTNRALSGGYFKLSAEISDLIDEEIIASQICFSSSWLKAKGQSASFKMNKLTGSTSKARFLDAVTTTKATFDGMNVSCWLNDILAVNGFDERMRYGGEDRELGERMMANGVNFKQVRYRAICLHLHHERPYVNKAAWEENSKIRKANKKNAVVWTPYGIKKESKPV